MLPYTLCQKIGLMHRDIISTLSAKIQSAEQLDLVLAGELISKKLVPFLEKHHITPDVSLYTSKYYDL